MQTSVRGLLSKSIRDRRTARTLRAVKNPHSAHVCKGYSLQYVDSLADRSITSDGRDELLLTLTTGGSAAATMTGVVLDHRAALHQAQIAGAMTLANPGLRSYLLNGGKAAQLAALAAAQSQVLAYADVALYTAILVFCVAPMALALRPQRTPRAGDAETPAP
jgi:hypothetical protein